MGLMGAIHVHQRRAGLLAVGALALGAYGCGSGDVDPPARSGSLPPSGTQSPRATADAFADALWSGSTRRMCALLVGQARWAQGCGEEGEDYGPLLRLTIRGREDIRVVEVHGGTATAHFPRLGRDEQGRPTPSWRDPQVMTLRRFDGAWKVSHLRFGSDYEPA
jgi:hypothetical protein